MFQFILAPCSDSRFPPLALDGSRSVLRSQTPDMTELGVDAHLGRVAIDNNPTPGRDQVCVGLRDGYGVFVYRVFRTIGIPKLAEGISYRRI